MPPEKDPPPLRLGPRVLTGIGLLLAIAGALAAPEGVPITGLATRVFVALPDWLIVAAVAALSIATLMLLAMTLPWRRKQGEDDDERYHEPLTIPPIVKVFLILLALMPGTLLGGAIWWLGRADVSIVPRAGGITAGNPPAPRAIEKEPARPASSVTTGLFGALALLAGFGSLGFVLWLRFGDRLPLPPGNFAPPHGRLAAAIEESLDELRREPDARAAIIKIYRNFERAFGGAGLPRRPWQTPVEFMRAVLGKLPLPAAPIRRLTGLFELARFSQHPVGAAERESAWRSLIEIRAALDRERQTPDAAPS